MTRRIEGRKERKGLRVPRPSVSEGLTLVLSALLLWLVLRDPAAVSEAALSGLGLSARSILPALFPFFVLSYLLTESGLGGRVGKVLAPLLRRLFGVSAEGAPALLLGAFCGFPVGARCVSMLCGDGRIGSREAERLLILSNSPSFAFLYSAVGAGFFGDRSFGLCLYFSVLLATVTVGILLRVLFGTCEEDTVATRKHASLRPAALVTRAVSSAAASSLSVTGYVVFFTVLSASLSRCLASCGSPDGLSLFLSGVLELTSGIKNAAETVYGLCGRVLCGFFAGFGGLCAALQVIATVEHPLPDRAVGKGLSFRSYFFCKALIGALTALLVLLFS